MRSQTLTEYKTTEAVPLSVVERDMLRGIAPSINVTPSFGKSDYYDLTPSSWVGAIQLPNLAIQIRPKIPIERVLFLVSYAVDPRLWQKSGFSFGPCSDLVEAVIPGFIYQCGKSLERGILSGYRREERASITVRGRIRMEEQIKRRFGIAPPVEISYDEFTEDIEENRLLKAALRRLGKLKIRSQQSLNQLYRYETNLNAVTLVEYDSRNLPNISFNRLNEHYRHVIELSKLILRSISYELSHGQIAGTAFLVDMNDVFQKFVTIALREVLRLNERAFPSGDRVGKLYLDTGQNVSLEPDISWWERGTCMFIGDIKYKSVNIAGIKHPDLYQLLAYVTAAGLRSGLLIYAAGEGEPKVHEVIHVGKRLEVMTLTLDGDPDSILNEIKIVSDKIRKLREEALADDLSLSVTA
jgi:5-methylcytosine-specific restriction enzyme subunit McrC